MADMEPSTESPGFHEANLTKGMEHMRLYVSVPDSHSPTPTKPEPTNDSTRTEEELLASQNRRDPFQFGTRYLEEGHDIFSHNAWDHVEVDEAFKDFAETQYQLQRESPVSDFDRNLYNEKPEKWWNRFYTNNSANFFKDRKWLFQEFPTLVAATAADSPPVKILELGAGAGNTAFPILAANRNPGLKIHACDYAPKAVELIQSNPAYDTKYIQADVWDVTAPPSEEGQVALPPGIEPGSVDVIVLIFILSALEPSQWAQALRNIYAALKPGGEVLFRDYGRGDLAQVRFKKGRWLDENFYIRGDGTRVYFFDKEELEQIWTGQQTRNTSTENTPQDNDAVRRVKFEVLNLAVDRRMLVNRQRRLKMYRCWMQGYFRKPLTTPTTDQHI